MPRKSKPAILSAVDVSDASAAKASFLAMRVRASQMTSRASRAIREARRLARHVDVLCMEMEMARQSLMALQRDLDAMLKGIEIAQKRHARQTN